MATRTPRPFHDPFRLSPKGRPELITDPSSDDQVMILDNPTTTPVPKRTALSSIFSIIERVYIYRYSPSDDGGTWTKPSDTNFIGVYVRARGPGGSGGGSGTNDKIGGGGAGGGACDKWIAAASLGSTETLAIGTGGAAPTAGNNAGNAGDKATAFGSHLSAGAGAGGQAGNEGTPATVAGGTATGGDYNFNGGRGGAPGDSVDADDTAEDLGNGGCCGYAYSATTNTHYLTTLLATYLRVIFIRGLDLSGVGALRGGVYESEVDGAAGTWPGGGGSGGWRTSVDHAGGAGADGYLEVVEYYSG